MDQQSDRDLPHDRVASEEMSASQSNNMPVLEPEEESWPPSLEITDGSEELDEYSCSPAVDVEAAGTGNIPVQAAISGGNVHSSTSSSQRATPHAAGMASNSRIWQIPGDADPQLHSLGPAPGDDGDDDQPQIFLLPSLQSLGPGGRGLVLSMPLPPSLAGIPGLSGLMSNGLMGPALGSNSRAEEPIFIQGGGLGMHTVQYRATTRHNSERNRLAHHHSSSNSQGLALGQLRNVQSVLQGLVPPPEAGPNTQPHRTTQSGTSAEAQAAAEAAAPQATASSAHVVSSNINNTQELLSSGAAVQHRADNVSAAGQVQPVRALSSRHMVHARRTRRTRPAESCQATAEADHAAAGREPFRFTAIPAGQPLGAATETQASNQVALVAGAGAQQAAGSTRPQDSRGAMLQQCVGSSDNCVRWWQAPWHLLTSGLRFLHRHVSCGLRAQASAGARASATARASDWGAETVVVPHVPIQGIGGHPSSAADFPASFTLDLDEDAVVLGPESPVHQLPAWSSPLTLQHERRSSRSQHSQRHTAATTSRRLGRSQQQQPQTDDDLSGDMYDEPCVLCSDGGSSPGDAGAPWLSNRPSLPRTQQNLGAVAASESVAASSSSQARGEAPSSSRNNRQGRPNAKRGRVDCAVSSGASHSVSSTAGPSNTTGTASAAACSSSSGVPSAGHAGDQQIPVTAATAATGSIGASETATETETASRPAVAALEQSPPQALLQSNGSTFNSCGAQATSSVVQDSAVAGAATPAARASAGAADQPGHQSSCSPCECELAEPAVPELVGTSESAPSEMSEGPPPLVGTSESGVNDADDVDDDEPPNLISFNSGEGMADAARDARPALGLLMASSTLASSDDRAVRALQVPESAKEDATDASDSMPDLDSGSESSGDSETDSDGSDSMPQLEHDSDEEVAAARADGRSNRLQGGTGPASAGGSSSAVGHSSGFRRGFLGQPLQRSTWSTQQQQQQQQQQRSPVCGPVVAPTPLQEQRQQQQNSPGGPELRLQGAEAGFPAFLQMMEREAFGLWGPPGSDTDDDDGPGDGWETASEEPDSDLDQPAHSGSELDPVAAIDRLLQSALQGRRHSSGRRSSRNATGTAGSTVPVAPFSRPRSNAFIFPGISSSIPAENALAQHPSSAQQASSRQADSITRQCPGPEAPVNGLPSLQRSSTSRAAARVSSTGSGGDSEPAKQALPAGLLSVAAAKMSIEHVSVALSDDAYIQQLLQGLPDVRLADATVMSALTLLKSKQYTLAQTATPSPDKGELVSLEEYMFARGLERSRKLCRRWHRQY